jgi:hypothetical protein
MLRTSKLGVQSRSAAAELERIVKERGGGFSSLTSSPAYQVRAPNSSCRGSCWCRTAADETWASFTAEVSPPG